MKRLLIITLIVICVPLASYAWNYEGHMTVVAIAYSTLTPTERQNINTVLQSHPWYGTWQNEYQQLGSSPGVQFPMYAFMRAATWPDDVRDTPADRPTWHYVNFPLNPPNSLNTNTSFAGELLPQINAALVVLATQPTTPAKKTARAIKLSWLLHLVGDLHQPLHTGALKNNTYPNGDRGGNLFWIRPKVGAQALKLHSFWDGILGNSRDAKVIVGFAAAVANKFPANSVAAELGGDYPTWAKESARIALEDGYQYVTAGGTRMRLPGSANESQAPVLPAGYETNARRVAWKRVALGGYRLGGMLSQIF